MVDLNDLHPDFKLYWVTVVGYQFHPPDSCLTNAFVVAHDENDAIILAVIWAEQHDSTGDGWLCGKEVDFVSTYAGLPTRGVVVEANGDGGVLSVTVTKRRPLVKGTVDDLHPHERLAVHECDGVWYANLDDDENDRNWEGTGSNPTAAIHAAISEYREAYEVLDP